MPKKDTWTWAQRRAEYQERRLTYLGGGLAGLGLFGAGDMGATIFAEAQWLRAMFVVSALLTAACFGLAWEPCNRLIQEIERDHGNEMDAQADANLSMGWGYYKTGLFLLLITAMLLAAAAVVSAVAPDDLRTNSLAAPCAAASYGWTEPAEEAYWPCTRPPSTA